MPKISFDDLTHSCAIQREIGPYPNSIEYKVGPFASNVKATITDTFDGSERKGIQIEGTRTSYIDYTDDIENWETGDFENVIYESETTDVDDPLGNNIANKIFATTDNDIHRVQNYCETDETVPIGQYVISTHLRTTDSNYLNRDEAWWSPTDVKILYDLDTPDYTIVSGADEAAVEECSDSWIFCWGSFDFQSPGEFNWIRYRAALYHATSGLYFAGSGTDGIYLYALQLEYGLYPTSTIHCNGSFTTRPAVNAYWDENDVDSNLRGKITVYIIPQFSSEHLYDEDEKHTLFHFDDETQNYQIYFEKGSSADTGRIIVYGASAVLTTDDHTWSRGQLLKLVIDPPSGEITTSLFTTGNDTHSGSSWSTDDGDVYLGQKNDNTEQFFGVIFEPEYESGGTARHLTANIAGISATPDDVDATLARSLVASITGSSITPDDITATIARHLIAVVAGQLATADNIEATIARSLIATITGQSTTPDDVAATIDRSLIAAIAGQSNTNDNVAVTLARSLLASIAGYSAAPDDVKMIMTRSLIAAMTGISIISDDITVIVARHLVAAILGQSVTVDNVETIVARSLVADIAGQSVTSDDVVATLARSLITTIMGQSTTPDDVVLTLGVLIHLVANIAGYSVTPDDVTVTIARSLLGVGAGYSVTSDDVRITMARFLLGAIAGYSATPDDVEMTLGNIIHLIAAISGQSVTSDDVTAVVARSLFSTISGQSVTPDNVVAIVARSLFSAISGDSVTPDDVTIMLGSIDVIKMINDIILAYRIPPQNDDLRVNTSGDIVLGVPVINAVGDETGAVRIRVNGVIKALSRIIL